MSQGGIAARQDRGFSLLEMAVALFILGVLLVAVFPYLTSRPMNLRADVNDLVSNLRLARDLSISQTTRYRIRVVSDSSYALERLDPNTLQWTQERVVALRDGIRFSGTRPNHSVEFDSRGRLAGTGALPAVPLPLTLEDRRTGQRRSVSVNSVGGVVEQ